MPEQLRVARMRPWPALALAVASAAALILSSTAGHGAAALAQDEGYAKTFSVRAKQGGPFSINAVVAPEQKLTAVKPAPDGVSGMAAKKGSGNDALFNMFGGNEDHHHGPGGDDIPLSTARPGALGAPVAGAPPSARDLLDLINKVDPEAAQMIQNAAIEAEVRRYIGRAAAAIGDAVDQNVDTDAIRRATNQLRNMIARAVNMRDPDSAAIETMGRDLLNGLTGATVNNPGAIRRAIDSVPPPPPSTPQDARDRAYDNNDFSGVASQAPAHASGNLRVLRDELLNAQGMAVDTIRNINSTPAQRDAARSFLRGLGGQLRAASGMAGDDTSLRNDLNQCANTADMVAEQWQNYTPQPGRQ